MTRHSIQWQVLCAFLMVGCGGADTDRTTMAKTEPAQENPSQTTMGESHEGMAGDTPYADKQAPMGATTPTNPATPEGTPPAESTAPATPSGAPSGLAPSAQPAAPVRAVVEVKLLKGDTTVGKITFDQTGGKVTMAGQFTGLPPGMHGIHIHEKGDCGGKAAKNAGTHLNPTHAKHGPPESATRHAGDFGNLKVDKEGNASFDMTTDSLTVDPGADSVVGRALIIHAKKDDGKSQPAGNSGPPIACGVIQLEGATETTSTLTK